MKLSWVYHTDIHIPGKRQNETEKVDGPNIIRFQVSGTLTYPCSKGRQQRSVQCAKEYNPQVSRSY